MDPDKVQIYGGVDEQEAVGVAKDAAPHYRKVVAKAMGGVLLYRKVNPVIRYFTMGWDGVNYRRIEQLYVGYDRDEAIVIARRHAGEFLVVDVLARGAHEEGFHPSAKILSIPREKSPA
jgi:hypothetical protein